MADLTAAFDPNDITTPGHYAPSQTALLLLDFHSLFINKLGGPDALAATQKAVEMRHWAKLQNISVIHAIIDVTKAPYATCKGRDRFIGVVATMKAEGADEPAELIEGKTEDELTFLRTAGYVNALLSPGLKEFLNEKGIKSLIMCGLSTSGCVLRTALPATDDEFIVSILRDACADPGKGVHDLVLGKILAGKCWVVDCQEWREGYEKARRGV